jgi:tight adherence protein B
VEPWLVTVIGFAAAFALVPAVDALLLAPMQRARVIHRRLVVDAQADAPAPRRLSRHADDVSWLARAGAPGLFVLQAGIRPDGPLARKLLGVGAPAAAAVLAGLAVVDPAWALIALAAALTSTVLALRQLRRRRLDRFGRALPDVIDIIVRDLRAGLPLAKALGSVGRLVPGAIGAEFEIVASEVAYGADIAEAFGRLSARVGHAEIDLMLAALQIGFQTGGDLTPILTKLSATIRKRLHLRRKLHALSAEMRLSAHILTALPVVVFALINLFSPLYYSEVWHLDIVWMVLLGCAVAMVAGNLVVRRLIDRQF